ncbi:MAG: glycosyltransferase family 4 protein [Halobacteriota archaeon]
MLRNRLGLTFVSTFPPRECGIATFTQDLLFNLINENPEIKANVCAIDGNKDSSAYGCLSPLIYPKSRVAYIIKDTDQISFVEAAHKINSSRTDVVNVQHEYGLYGGSWGRYILDFMDVLDKPIVTTLHTVMPKPPEEAKAVMREIYHLSAEVVVPGHVGVDILNEAYDLRPEKVRVIPHGVPDVPFISSERPKKKLGFSRRFVLGSFGLLHPAKGIEFVLEALPKVIADNPAISVLYLVVGETHPNVVKNEGESYRARLKQLIANLDLEQNVKFVDKYLTNRNLILYFLATDICVLPYLSRDQIVSGVLSQAVGCGKAIIATPYLHALDALADERGVILESGSSDEIAEAITMLISNDHLRREMEIRTYMYGRSITWKEVARKYRDLFSTHVVKRGYSKTEFSTSKRDTGVL